MTVAAVVLAAGSSRRMGRDKLTLPWGEHTVIEQVLASLQTGGVSEIWLVTGAAHAALDACLAGRDLHLVYNPDHAGGEMTRSLQVGLNSLPPQASAALVVLGDQPQIEPEVVQAVVQAYQQQQAGLVVPSYQRRRGHPWLLSRRYWLEVLALSAPETLRDFLNRRANDVYYINTGRESILLDLDTPQDYQEQRP